MAVITPSTDLKLLKVPLEMDSINQLTFASKEAQYNYFNSLPKLEVDDFTYQRKDGVVRFGVNFDDVLGYNYCMYRNDEFSDKWFYAYITDVIWKSPNSTDMAIRTDVWQTWQFDLNYKPVFVEREHVNDDTVGANTVPENLEIGEYIANGVYQDFTQTAFSTAYLCVGVSRVISPFTTNPLTNWLTVYGGIYSGLSYMFFDSFVSLQRVIDYYTTQGYAEDIQTIFYVPKSFIDASSPKTQTYTLSSPTNTATVTWIEPSETPITTTTTFGKPTSLAGYYPRNNKLFCQPFCFFNITNNVGGEYTYNYEDFTGNDVIFNSNVALSPSMSIIAYPSNYKNGTSGNNWSYGVSGNRTPQCSWITDYYTNWLTQNAVNIGIQGFETAFSTAANLTVGNLAGAGGSLFSGISSIVSEHYRAAHVPNQVNGNVNNGDVSFSSAKCCFTYLPKCIKNEYARMCDDYFDMFGYAVHRVKLPNVTGRRNWNYVKTQGCYIEGDIPQEDMQELKQMFDSGVTFWHNPATFADYSQNNDII